MAQIVPNVVDGTAMTTVELLEAEGSAMGFMYLGGVQTLSFFSGDIDEAYTYYSTRLASVLKANPWLAGKLINVKDERGVEKVHLQYPAEVASEEDAKVLLTSANVFGKVELAKCKPSPTNSYIANFQAITAGKCIIPDGYTCIAEKLSQAKFSLIKCEEGFALVASISHVVCDGHTYYKIMSMLTETGTVEALSTARKHAFSTEDKKILGQTQANFIFDVNWYNMGFMYQAIGGICCCKSKKFVSYFLDSERVTILKSKVKEEGEVEYCSTLDLITSHFCNATQPRLLQYAVNLRARMPSVGLTSKDAGNYETVILLADDQYSKPAEIRKVINTPPDTPFSHSGSEGKRALPKGCEAFRARTAILTSWCFDHYSGDLSFGSCKQTLHVPMMELTAAPMDFAIIYKATPTRMGVFFMVDPHKVTALQANSDTVLSEEECFPAC